MARTGLQRMPTFPSPSLSCGKAGIPRYGSKAGLSERAFLITLRLSLLQHARRVIKFASILRVLRCSIDPPLRAGGHLLDVTPPCERLRRSTPGPSLRFRLCCP